MTTQLKRTRRCRVDTGCRHTDDNSSTSPCYKCQYSGEGFGDQFVRNIPLPRTSEQDRLFRAMHGIPQKKEE